jgi:hypothetical protein
MSLFREDMILSDSVCYQFTTRQREGFHTFSYHFAKKFPGYTIDRSGAIVPSTAKTINYKQQMDMLKSRDPSLLEANRWVYDGNFRFLDG